jgi:hypothetical protein
LLINRFHWIDAFLARIRPIFWSPESNETDAIGVENKEETASSCCTPVFAINEQVFEQKLIQQS